MRTKAKLAAAALMVAALIAGCSPSGGTAAVVNGEPLAVQEVDDAMALAPYFSQPPAPKDVLMSLIQAREVIAAATDHGLGVSKEQAADYLDQLGASEIRIDGEYADAVLDIVRMELIAQGLQVSANGQAIATEVNERVSGADIELNPRYGAWDASQGTLVQAPANWLQFQG